MGQKKRHYTVEGFRPSANPPLSAAMRALGSSSAAQPHVPKPRKGTRTQQRRAAVQDQK
ncbi:hypothetical protein SAMN06295974_3799 [Plantibacter flavus]|uniref:Uncharacterized protein n=1 Tax=Plantibacter flavus TaxID=150123 RepID=A0A3N2BLA1_9MICO|nr:hypothetical protein EDD42_4006 [Plantibacter flavus]SMG48975.1 hypothetical protein SAMN06295974_3799 [Plantibacter flavus]